MKQHLQRLLRAACVLCTLALAASPLPADLPNQRKAIDDLQAAKKAADPIALLESVKSHLSKANKGNKFGDRNDALDKLEEAINELKAGNRSKMDQKINATIANIHQGKGSSKRPE
jgi:hypothetical protein